eukprot:288513_1
MAVVLETSLGNIVIDLFTDEAPKTCLNFLKLCTIKYYNNCLFHSVQKDFIAQTGDPTGTGKGGSSIWHVINKNNPRFIQSEIHPKLSHNKIGTVSMACLDSNKDKLGSQFFISLTSDLKRLDKHYTIFGEVAEGFDILTKINESFVDINNCPMRNIRIRHTIIIDDPFDNNNMNGLNTIIPEHSPQPALDKYDYERIRDNEQILENGKSEIDLKEEIDYINTKSNAQILVMLDDIPNIDSKPPENVLFVCRLNSITTDEDLKIIFKQFGKILSCEIIRDWKTGDSLQYAFIEYDKIQECQKAYIKMENALIDDRRIHVDFSQSVAKYYWHHKNKGKFNKNKMGHTHKRVQEANKIWNKNNNNRNDGSDGDVNDELQFVSIGNKNELSEKFNKSKYNNNDKKRDRDRGRDRNDNKHKNKYRRDKPKR